MHKYRTNTCNELRKEDVGKSVKLSGFIRTIRDYKVNIKKLY